MPAETMMDLTRDVWAYADETGQDPRDVYVRLLTLIWLDRPEVVNEAFARMQTPVRGCGDGHALSPGLP